MGCRGLRRRRAKHGTQAGGVQGRRGPPDLRLANVLLELIRHVALTTHLLPASQRHHRIRHPAGARTRPALDRTVQLTHVRGTPATQRVPEGWMRRDRKCPHAAWPGAEAGGSF